MSLEAKNKEVVRRWNDIFNSRRWDLLDEVLAENYMHHSSGTSLEEAKRTLPKTSSESLPKARIEDMIAEGDKVAIRSTLLEEGKEPRAAIVYYRLSDGKIVDDWYALME